MTVKPHFLVTSAEIFELTDNQTERFIRMIVSDLDILTVQLNLIEVFLSFCSHLADN